MNFFDAYLIVELLFLFRFVGFNLYDRLLLFPPLHILRNQGSTYCEEETATKRSIVNYYWATSEESKERS